MKKSITQAYLLLFSLFSTLWCQAQLVSVGEQGTLVYQAYANEGQTNEVNTVPDFSMAGYRGGGVAIPTVPVKVIVIVDPAPGDDYRTTDQQLPHPGECLL